MSHPLQALRIPAAIRRQTGKNERLPPALSLQVHALCWAGNAHLPSEKHPEHSHRSWTEQLHQHERYIGE